MARERRQSRAGEQAPLPTETVASVRHWGEVIAGVEDRLCSALEEIRSIKRQQQALEERLAAESAADNGVEGDLADRLADMEGALDHAVAELEGERQRAHRLQDELNETREAAAALERELTARDHALDMARRESEALRERLRELEVASTRLAHAEEAVQRLDARCRVLEEELSRQKERNRTLEETLKSRGSAEDESEQLRREVADLQTLVDALNAEGETLRRRLGDQGALLAQRTRRLEVLRERVQRAEAALAEARTREASAQWSAAEREKELGKERSAREAAENRARELQERAATLEQALARAHAHEVSLEARLREETARNQERLRQLTQQWRSAEAQVRRLQQAHAAERSELLELTEKLQNRLASAEAECTRLQGQIAGLSEVKERLEKEVERFRARYEQVARAGSVSAFPAVAEHTSQSREPLPLAPQEVPIVAIGASTGGPAALGDLVSVLPGEFPACILIVQHMPAGYTADLAYCLGQRTELMVSEARHGDLIRPGYVYVAPGGHHMEVVDGEIRLSAGPRVNNQRPSVDILFDSLLPMARRVCAVLLSGMGKDGVSGMVRLRAAGARTVVQDEESSVVWGMPGAAVEAGCVERQLAPTELGRYLAEGTWIGEGTEPAARDHGLSEAAAADGGA